MPLGTEGICMSFRTHDHRHQEKKKRLNLALIHQFQKGPLSTRIPCWHPCSSTASMGKLSGLSTLIATNNNDARRTPANGDNIAQNIVKHSASLVLLRETEKAGSGLALGCQS